ncbi:MAG: BatA domain-containing protein [Bacteroidota bacterium]|nr:BatA domain-containing protein [Bacteroidota bacterium]
MRYQNPQLLYALFAIAIPIIIHLFNLRKYKTVRFSSVRFLKQIKKAKRSRSRLKNILILLSRILAITCLVLAFAKPYFPAKERQTIIAKNICFYIDNSLSMESISEDGMLIDVAKSKAEEIVKQHEKESNFFIITNDFSAKHNHSFSGIELSKRIRNIKTSPHQRSVSAIYSRLQSLTNEYTQLYLLTDMQKSTFSIEDLNILDSNINALIIPLSSTNTNNLYFDSCWANSPIIQQGKPIEIVAMLSNKSDIKLENIPAFLHVNNQQKAITNFSILPNETTEIEFKFTPLSSGFKGCEISLQDYPISFDDRFYFSFRILDKIKVLSIYENSENIALKTLYSNDDAFHYKSVNVGQINYDAIKNQQLLILDGLSDISSGLLQTIEAFVQQGGNLGIIPNNDINFTDYNQLSNLLKIDDLIVIDTTKQKVNKIAYNHQVFDGVFQKEEKKINLPIVSKHYKFSNKYKTNKQSIFSLEMGDDFISHYQYNTANIYLFSSPLNNESSNFSNHALFVPLMYNIALMSTEKLTRFNRINEKQYFDAPALENSEYIYHLQSKNFDIIPAEKFVAGKRKLYLHDQLKKAGNYKLTANNHTKDIIAFNYDKKESVPALYSISEVEDIFYSKNIKNIMINKKVNQQTTNIVQELSLGKSYWKIFIVFTLLFLLIEILFIKYLKS